MGDAFFVLLVLVLNGITWYRIGKHRGLAEAYEIVKKHQNL